MSALLLATVFGARREACVASDSQMMMSTIRNVTKVLNYASVLLKKCLLSADHLLAVKSLREGSKRGIEDTSTKAEDKMEG